MNGRNKEIYNGIEEECYIKINIFTNGVSHVVDVYAKVMQTYQTTTLSDGGDIASPKQTAWW